MDLVLQVKSGVLKMNLEYSWEFICNEVKTKCFRFVCAICWESIKTDHIKHNWNIKMLKILCHLAISNHIQID